ncbi:MAG: hypothetical protein H6R07_675 [Proteobacteria bacterium]|nr:hypothetical protein [Pseudomonadota bacterium]
MSITLEQRIQHLEDQAAIKRVVDTFSNLADVKDIASQMYLFTEDATVNTYFGDTLFASMKGREEIGKVFSSFIASFETMYHMNGQCTIEIDGDHATSTHYCLVFLVGEANGKKFNNSNGVIYQDEYVRRDGTWLIASRTARFTWRDVGELVAPN